MMGKPKVVIWTKKMDAKLKELNPTKNAKELSKIFGVTTFAIKRQRSVLGLTKPDRRTIWNDENEAYLNEHYPNTKIKDLAEIMGLSTNAIIAKAFMLRLVKTAEFRSKVALEGSVFHKNHKPWNTGMKGLQMGGIETQFKKGHQPHNTKKDGDISIRKDKKGKSHEYVRVGLAIWIEKKIIVWEKHHGKIPPKMCIRVIDGDTMNTAIENLEMITMRENRIRNGGARDLTDNYVAMCLAGKKLRQFKEVFLKHPELIELKRTTMKTKRLCQEKSQKTE